MIEDVPELVQTYFKTKTTFRIVEELKGIYKIIPRKTSAVKEKSPKQKSPR